MKIQARLNNFRRSAQKVRQSSSIIKGLDIADATVQLENSKKGDAEILEKLLLSAIANAENNHNVEKSNLFVSNVIVEEGRTLKRWRPRAYGRAAQILKRTCNVIIFLDEKKVGKMERKDGKKKKLKTDMKRETKNRTEEKTKAEKLKEGKKEKESLIGREDKDFKRKSKAMKEIHGKKVYRRKSF